MDHFNHKFQKQTLPSLHLDTSVVAKMVTVVKQEQNGKQCTSHLGLHCLQKYLSWSTGQKELYAKPFVVQHMHEQFVLTSTHNLCFEQKYEKY